MKCDVPVTLPAFVFMLREELPSDH